MGVETERAKGALRLSLGHTTTQNDIDRAIAAITSSVKYIQSMSGKTRPRAKSGVEAS
jgi:cysteine sulfinate desulfinase/cysteine desulfurase-like protein